MLVCNYDMLYFSLTQKVTPFYFVIATLHTVIEWIEGNMILQENTRCPCTWYRVTVVGVLEVMQLC